MNLPGFRFSLPLVLVALSSGASAVGLGEMRGQPSLGEPLRLEIDLLGSEKQVLDAACFRLEHPAGSDDLPWLRQAALNVRKGKPQVLEIRSDSPVREPILQVAIRLGCGHEISRQYLVLASPRIDVPRQSLTPEVPKSSAPSAPAVVAGIGGARQAAEVPQRLAPRRAERRAPARGMADRLMLSGGGDSGDPGLRLSTELQSWRNQEAREAQRDILRLEYRMLMALNEQAGTQLATAEKLRKMEETLGELQQQAGNFATRAEAGAEASTPAAMPTPPATPEPAVPVAPPVANPVAKAAAPAESGLSDWSLYGGLLGVVLGLAGWLGWRNYRERRLAHAESELPPFTHDLAIDPRRESEVETEHHALDFSVELGTAGAAVQLDVILDGGEERTAPTGFASHETPAAKHDPMAISASTVDEHFEANPVMELADIMLSFGRVKGAAQALQEYIDNSPQEALQPWIRLMDVYRMAGMREEFEKVAHNLNQHFNVEVQSWEASAATGAAIALPAGPRPQTLEDMPRLMEIVCKLWPSGDVVGYLYQLLRDNRGGKRAGFALPVVEEILFLIELKETSNRFE